MRVILPVHRLEHRFQRAVVIKGRPVSGQANRYRNGQRLRDSQFRLQPGRNILLGEYLILAVALHESKHTVHRTDQFQPKQLMQLHPARYLPSIIETLTI